MAARTRIDIGDGASISCFDPEGDIRDRFWDIKADLRADNRRVLSTLFDLYWLHREREEATR